MRLYQAIAHSRGLVTGLGLTFLLGLASSPGHPQTRSAPLLATALPGTRPELALRIGHTNIVGPLAFSSDGHLLTSAGEQRTYSGYSPDRSLRVWDIATGLCRNLLAQQPSPVFAITFSQDNKLLLTGGFDGIIRVYRVPEQPLAPLTLLRTLPATTVVPKAIPLYLPTDIEQEGISDLSWAPDGKTLASIGYFGPKSNTNPPQARVQLWDFESGELRRSIMINNSDTVLARFNKDGSQLVTVRKPGVAQWWDVATGQAKQTVNLPAGVVPLALSPDAQLVLVKEKTEFKIYATSSGQLRSALEAPQRPLGLVIGASQSAAFTPDGNSVLVAFYNKTVRLYDVATGHQRLSFVAPGHETYSLAMTTDGQTLALGDDNASIQLCALDTGKLLHAWPGYTTWPTFVTASVPPTSKNPVVTVESADLGLTTWNLATGQAPAMVAPATSASTPITYSPDGKLMAYHSSLRATRGIPRGTPATDEIKVLDRLSGQVLWSRADDPSARVFSLAFLPDNQTLATSAFNPDVYQSRRQPAPDPTAPLADGFHDLQFWNARTGQPLPTPLDFAQESAPINPNIIVSADGSRLVLAGPLELSWWDLKAGKFQHKLTANNFRNRLIEITLTPDGRFMAGLDSSRSVLLWDLQAPRSASQNGFDALLQGHEYNIRATAITPDGKLLISADDNGTINFWDITNLLGHRETGAMQPETLKPLRSLAGDGVAILALSATPNSRSLVCAKADGRVQLRDLATGSLRATLMLFRPTLSESGGAQLPVAVSPAPAMPTAGVDWLVYTPAGYYDASPGGENYIGWQFGTQLYPATKYAPQYHRPDLVRQAILGP